MIGFYIHHHGRGHLSRAIAIAGALGRPVTGLSSLPRPSDWPGEWVLLPSDATEPAHAPDAHGQLHWAPLGHAGLRARMAMISQWIDDARPRALVVDVSVEVALLARLHGVPIITVAMPGRRADAAHALGHTVSTAIIAAWPPDVRGMLEGLPSAALERVHPVGAISRFLPTTVQSPSHERRVVVFGGTGGDAFTADAVKRAAAETPEWDWRHLGGNGVWTDDPWEALVAANVVITHAGESALAEVAAARRPAIVIPQSRPYDEQRMTGAVLAEADWPAIVLPTWPIRGWGELLREAASLDGARWEAWNDGCGAQRAAAVVVEAATVYGVAA